jgi:hypothetical protein
VTQEKVLKAALLPPADAAPYWEALLPSLDLDHLDGETTRVLPMVYRNLESTGALGAETGRLKGLYRRTWYGNQKLFHELARLLEVLSGAGIATVLLKGMAMTETHYGDRGVRAAADLDVLVRPEETARAVDALASDSWRLAERFGWYGDELTPEVLRRIHAYPMSSERGADCDMHWHLDDDQVASDAAYKNIERVWERTIPLQVGDAKTSVLDPAAALVHACAHGVTRSQTASIRWIADAYTLVNTPDKPVEWDVVVRLAMALRAVLPMQVACDYLAKRFQAPIPPDAIRALSRAPVSTRDRILFWSKGRVVPPTHLGNAQRVLIRYTRSHQGESSLAYLRGVPGAFKDHWDLQNSAQIPGRAAVAIYRAARNLVIKSSGKSPEA